MERQYIDLDDQTLRTLLKQEADQEHCHMVNVIEMLEELDRRKLYLRDGYGDLVEYCVKILKYSETGARRRLAAMRLCREIPEVKDRLRDGSLNLMKITRSQHLFRIESQHNHPFSVDEKREILKLIENKTQSETERILAERANFETPREEKCIPVKNDKFLITLEISTDLHEKIEEFKAMISHKNPRPTMAEVLHEMACVALGKKSPKKRTKKDECDAQPPVMTQSKKRPYISAAIKRQIWREADAQCTYVSSETNKKCGSCFQLEIDHIIPLAHGGSSDIENLRLVCRAHNHHFAEEAFGDDFMRKFGKSKAAGP